MPREDSALRELIRRNVGYPTQPDALHRAQAVSPASILTPYSSTPAALVTAGGVIAPEDLSLGVPGRSLYLGLNLAAGTRGVAASLTLSFPYIIRRVVFIGTVVFGEAASFRLMVSPDNDETPVAVPTGTDVIRFNTVVIGAEDVGLHSNLNVDSTAVEPWTRVTDTPTYLKLKAHNATAGTRVFGVYVDLDDITSPVL
jgi:hypothetical protein